MTEQTTTTTVGVRISRFAIQYKTQSLVVEYYRGDKVYKKKIRIRKSRESVDTGQIVDKIIEMNQDILSARIVSRSQVEHIVSLLLSVHSETASGEITTASTAPATTRIPKTGQKTASGMDGRC